MQGVTWYPARHRPAMHGDPRGRATDADGSPVAPASVAPASAALASRPFGGGAAVGRPRPRLKRRFRSGASRGVVPEPGAGDDGVRRARLRPAGERRATGRRTRPGHDGVARTLPAAGAALAAGPAGALTAPRGRATGACSASRRAGCARLLRVCATAARAAFTRSGVNGTERSRAPAASNTALPIAAGTTTTAGSPTPHGGSSARSIGRDSTFGTSGKRWPKRG